MWRQFTSLTRPKCLKSSHVHVSPSRSTRWNPPRLLLTAQQSPSRHTTAHALNVNSPRVLRSRIARQRSSWGVVPCPSWARLASATVLNLLWSGPRGVRPPPGPSLCLRVDYNSDVVYNPHYSKRNTSREGGDMSGRCRQDDWREPAAYPKEQARRADRVVETQRGVPG